jgi:hypothetical protein
MAVVGDNLINPELANREVWYEVLYPLVERHQFLVHIYHCLTDEAWDQVLRGNHPVLQRTEVDRLFLSDDLNSEELLGVDEVDQDMEFVEVRL